MKAVSNISSHQELKSRNDTMIILIGFIETVIIALISILIGFFMAYELFGYNLEEQLLRYHQKQTLKELQELASDENKKL